MPALTFPDLLAEVVARAPGRPLVTFYDDATEERVELSAATYANWVSKTAGLLVDELDLDRGDTVRVDLPVHWLATVLLGATWTAGLVLADTDQPDAAVCGPATLDRWATRAGAVPVLACSLRPLGAPFAERLPPGVRDLGVEVWSQPDAFVAADPPGPDDLATSGLSHRALVTGTGLGLADGVRLLSTAPPPGGAGPALFAEVLARHGSLVLVAHPDPGRVPATYAAERATARHPPV